MVISREDYQMSSNKSKITINKTIEFIPINSSMGVFKLSTETSHESSVAKEDLEGVAELEVLRNWNGIDEKIHNGFLLLSNDVLDKYKKYGMCSDHFMHQKWTFKDLNDAIDKTPFTSVKFGNMENKQFMKLSSYDHSLTLLDGTIISKPLYFNYIEARIDNARYDLEQLAEIIHKRSDIVFWNKNGLVQGPLTDAQCEGLISEIPHYNQDVGCNETLEFIWALPQEEFDKMNKELGHKVSTNDMFRYIAKHDLLGIETAKIVPPEPELPKKSKFRI